MKETLSPVEERGRIQSLDLLRGFAVAGIFLVNMPSFHSPVLYGDGNIQGQGWDRNLYRFTDIAAQASFYPLLAFLFGYGAMILAARSLAKSRSFPILFTKRLCFLLIVGILHAFFIWHGDILINYAIFGFLLLLFYKWKGNQLLGLGSFLYLAPFTVLGVLYLLIGLSDPAAVQVSMDEAEIKESLQVYSSGSFADVFLQRMTDWYLVNRLSNLPFLFLSIFPFFLIGAGAAKKQWLSHVSLYRRQTVVIAWIGLLGGLFLKTLPYVTVYNDGTLFVQDYLGGPLLAAFYLAGFALWTERPGVMARLQPLIAAGRMSMSNYLFQSILCTAVFYSSGLGLYGKIAYTTGFLLVIPILLFQLFFSQWWLGRYQLGPVEYLWRMASYGKESVRLRRDEKGEK